MIVNHVQTEKISLLFTRTNMKKMDEVLWNSEASHLARNPTNIGFAIQSHYYGRAGVIKINKTQV